MFLHGQRLSFWSANHQIISITSNETSCRQHCGNVLAIVGAASAVVIRLKSLTSPSADLGLGSQRAYVAHSQEHDIAAFATSVLCILQVFVYFALLKSGTEIKKAPLLCCSQLAQEALRASPASVHRCKISFSMAIFLYR